MAERRLLVWMLIVAGMSVAVLQVVESVLLGHVVNGLTAERSVWGLLTVWAVLGLIGIGINVILALAADRLAHRNKFNVLTLAFEGAMHRPPNSSDIDGTGAVIRNVLIGCDACFLIWLAFFREIVPALTALVVLVPVAIVLSPALSVTLLVLIAVYLAANLYILGRTQSGQRDVDMQYRSLSSRVTDVVTNAGLVRAFTRLHQETAAIQDMSRAILERQYPVLNWWAVLNVFTRASATISVVLVLIVGAFLVGQNGIAIGTVVTFAGFATLLITRLEQAAGAVTRMYPAAPPIEALLSLTDIARAERATEPVEPIEIREGRVEYDDVSFVFPGTRVGLHHVSFTAEPGQVTAIVGTTGSGKSTLLSLLQRMIVPDSGAVRIDGQDLSTVSADSIRAQISLVAQDTGLFDRSVADNLRVGQPLATEQEMIDALKAAEVYPVVERAPEGLDFRIGERGSRLSGGERQRLSIARALLKDAPILILDEATSALDTVTEARIQRAIETASRGRTTFIIAHRLSTIRHADRILVLDAGRIVQQGTLSELEDSDGPFQDFLEANRTHTPASPDPLTRARERGLH